MDFVPWALRFGLSSSYICPENSKGSEFAPANYGWVSSHSSLSWHFLTSCPLMISWDSFDQSVECLLLPWYFAPYSCISFKGLSNSNWHDKSVFSWNYCRSEEPGAARSDVQTLPLIFYSSLELHCIFLKLHWNYSIVTSLAHPVSPRRSASNHWPSSQMINHPWVGKYSSASFSFPV